MKKNVMFELRNLLVAFLSLSILFGCDSQPSSRVVTQMRNITNVSVLTELPEPADYATGTANSSVLIESYKIPIMDIALSWDDDIQASNYSDFIYLCNREEGSDCYVDLVTEGFNVNVLPENTSAVGFIKEGEYTSMQLGTCYEGDSYTALVQAKVDLLGEIWYTQAGSPVLVNSEDSYSATEIEMKGCTHYSIFTKPYVVGKRTSYLNLYYDLENIARGLVIDLYPDEQGRACSWQPNSIDLAPSLPILCVEVPELLSLTNKDSLPELRRFRWGYGLEPNQSTILGLYFDSENMPLGGFTRLNYTDSYFETPRVFQFKSVKVINNSLQVTDFTGPGRLSVLESGDNTIKNHPSQGTGSNMPVYNSNGETFYMITSWQIY